MALQSQLFRGDPKLEAAAVSDPAHIELGAKGEHVRKIQLALIQLDGAVIAADGGYGLATAAAVLAYKKKRNIINRSYQTQADNIVGKMTIAAMDKELLAAEPKHDDRTPHCVFHADTEQTARRSFAVGAGPALTGFMLLDEARASLPTAKSWVVATLLQVGTIEFKLKSLTVPTPADMAPIETHFKVNMRNVPMLEARNRMSKIREMFEKILQVLTVLETDRLVGNPGVTAKAMAPLGGINRPAEVVTIGGDFHNSNANMRAAVLIHEAGHFADATCSHAASEQPAPHGSPIKDEFGTRVNPRKLNYAQLDFALHMQNAYSFAQCAMHNGLRRDKRPP
jgi:hypothetical protein